MLVTFGHRLALDKDPEYVRALVLMGQTLLQNGELGEATECLERAISKVLLHICFILFFMIMLYLFRGLFVLGDMLCFISAISDDHHRDLAMLYGNYTFIRFRGLILLIVGILVWILYMPWPSVLLYFLLWAWNL